MILAGTGSLRFPPSPRTALRMRVLSSGREVSHCRTSRRRHDCSNRSISSILMSSMEGTEAGGGGECMVWKDAQSNRSISSILMSSE